MTYKVSPEGLKLLSPQSTRTHRDMGTLGDMNIPRSVHDRKEINQCAEDRKTYHLLAGVLSGEAHSQQDQVLGHLHELKSTYNMISHLKKTQK